MKMAVKGFVRAAGTANGDSLGSGLGTVTDGLQSDQGDWLRLHLRIGHGRVSFPGQRRMELWTGRSGPLGFVSSPNKAGLDRRKLMRADNPNLAVRILIVVGFALSVLSSNSLWAQGETTSAIVGSVSDPSGDPIAGATVTIRSTDNGITRSVKTDEAGRFSFPQLKPGPYSVRVQMREFEDSGE